MVTQTLSAEEKYVQHQREFLAPGSARGPPVAKPVQWTAHPGSRAATSWPLSSWAAQDAVAWEQSGTQEVSSRSSGDRRTILRTVSDLQRQVDELQEVVRTLNSAASCTYLPAPVPVAKVAPVSPSHGPFSLRNRASSQATTRADSELHVEDFDRPALDFGSKPLRQAAPGASERSLQQLFARSPSEEALLELYRERRAKLDREVPELLERPEADPPAQSESPRLYKGEEPTVAAQATSAMGRRSEALAISRRSLSNPASPRGREGAMTSRRPWQDGATRCTGGSSVPALWRVVLQRMVPIGNTVGAGSQEPESSRQQSTSKRHPSKSSTSPADLPTAWEEAAGSMPLAELAGHVAVHLESRFGCLEAVAILAALEMGMCTERQIDSVLVANLDVSSSTMRRGCRDITLNDLCAALPPVRFTAQQFEDALLEAIQVPMSRRAARRLFKLLAMQGRGFDDGIGGGSGASVAEL
ncbi:unnamed protein product [Polarella glacialis]|uniref:Uncharacterized protein n=2 Tax=Polarella glacialis TaxID=89957 RepID=A0A813DJ49_POLGL|nr:unnamed protein product [Polarella glacialis]